MEVLNYKKISHIPCIYKGNMNIAIRAFESNSKRLFTLVDINTLKVSLIEQNQCKYSLSDSLEKCFKKAQIKSSTYYKSLKKFNVINESHFAQGLTCLPAVNGIFLSINIASSIKKMDYSFFESLLVLIEQGIEVNLLIAVSGLWIVTHKEDFRHLQSLRSKLFNIEWVNNSFSNVRYSDIEDEHNFLLLPNIDLEYELLETEKLIIENNEIPSPFFRFPGLISDSSLVKLLTSYGLIQLGAKVLFDKPKTEYEIKKGDIVLCDLERSNSFKETDLLKQKKFIFANLKKELKSFFINNF